MRAGCHDYVKTILGLGHPALSEPRCMSVSDGRVAHANPDGPVKQATTVPSAFGLPRSD